MDEAEHVPGSPATETSAQTCTICGYVIKAATGGGGGGIIAPPIEEEKDSVTNSPTDGSTTADLSNAVTVDGGNAEAKVDQSLADKIIEKAVENKSTEIVLEAETAEGKTESTSVTLPEKTVKELAEKTDAQIVINTDGGSVTLDKEAVDSLAAQAGNDGNVTLIIKTVESATDKKVIELLVNTSNGDVTDFNGGKVTVTVPLTGALASDPVLKNIDSEGILNQGEGTLNSDGTFTFEAAGFDQYAVMTKDAAEAAVKEQTAKIKATALKLKSTKGKGYVKLTWTKSGKYDLDGYDVYRGKARTSLKRWGGTSKMTYKNAKSLKKGTTYYYKVRGYKVVDGKKIYTKWSNVNYRKAI